MAALTNIPLLQNTKRPLLATVVWFVIALTTVGTSLAFLPAQYQTLQIVCNEAACQGDLFRIPAAGAELLQRWELSLASYAALNVTLALLTSVVFWGVATLIFTRTDNWIAYLVSLALLLLGSMFLGYAPVDGAFWGFLQGTENYLLFVCLVLGFYLFPDGRFTPGWIRWVAAALFVTEFFYSYFPAAPFAPHNFFPPLEFVIWWGALLLIPFSQVYRYMHVSGPTERQQTKWVVVGLTVIFLNILAIVLLNLWLPTALRPAVQLIIQPWLQLVFLAIPITLLIAMLHFRLWDVDVLIRRTVIYTLLSGLLLLIYLSSVMLAQFLFSRVVGNGSQLAIVISTLGIAVLFNPLLHRVQDFIDRHFYRRKYNAQQTLAAFTASTRSASSANLEHLIGELVRVIDETVQPASLSIWLREEPSKVGVASERAK